MALSTCSPNTTHVLTSTTHSIRAKSDPTWNHCKLVQDVDGMKIPFEVRHQLKEQLNPPIPTKDKGKTNTLGFAPITTQELNLQSERALRGLCCNEGNEWEMGWLWWLFGHGKRHKPKLDKLSDIHHNKDVDKDCLEAPHHKDDKPKMPQAKA
ncbi:hypothetical protein Lal_00031973 [Lupinus albus]|nr:hypothetical protein Lal_00031973 [Lupinus albus]